MCNSCGYIYLSIYVCVGMYMFIIVIIGNNNEKKNLSMHPLLLLTADYESSRYTSRKHSHFTYIPTYLY